MKTEAVTGTNNHTHRRHCVQNSGNKALHKYRRGLGQMLAMLALAELVFAIPIVRAGESCGKPWAEYLPACTGTRAWCGYDDYDDETTVKYLMRRNKAVAAVYSADFSGMGATTPDAATPGYWEVSGTATWPLPRDIGASVKGVLSCGAELPEIFSFSYPKEAGTGEFDGGTDVDCDGNAAVSVDPGIGITVAGSFTFTPSWSSLQWDDTIQTTVDGTGCTESSGGSFPSANSQAFPNPWVWAVLRPDKRQMGQRPGFSGLLWEQELLIPNTRCDVANSILDGMAGCPTEPAGAWPTTALHAQNWLHNNGFTVNLSKVRYRIGISSEKSVNYLVTWNELHYYAESEQVESKTQSDVIFGNGSTAYTDKTHDLIPPLCENSTAIVDESSIKVTPLGGSPDCCGGGGSPAGDGSADIGSVRALFSLGTAAFGKSGGALLINADTITNLLSMPAGLQFIGLENPVENPTDPNGLEVIRDGNGIRQVKSAQAVADVQTDGTDLRYFIKFYTLASLGNGGNKVGNYYTFSANPYVTWTVVGSAANTRLRIIETRGANSITSDYGWDQSAKTLTLTNGNGLRTETKKVDWSVNGNEKIRTETRKVYTGEGPFDANLVYQEIKKYKVYWFGAALLEERIGTADSEQVTTYSHSMPSGDQIYVTRMTRSDGYWEYTPSAPPFGSISSPFMNSALNGVSITGPYRQQDFWFDWSWWGVPDDQSVQPAAPRRMVETIKGTAAGDHATASRIDYYQADKHISLQQQGWNGAYLPNYDSTDKFLGTTNYTYTSGPFAGYLESVCHPDGTGDTYVYAVADIDVAVPGDEKIITARHGQLVAGSTTQIVNGTRTDTVIGSSNQTLSVTHYAIQEGVNPDVVTAREVYSNFDDQFRAGRVTYLDGTYKEFNYNCDCGGLNYMIDRDGTRTDYTYDALKRLKTETRNGITIAYEYDGMGRVLKKTRQGTGTPVIPLERNGYDAAGRLTAVTNALGEYTLFSETVVNNQLQKTTTNPDGSTVVQLFYRDGTLQQVSGTGAHPVSYERGIVNEGGWMLYDKETRRISDGVAGNESVTNIYDPAGRLVKKAFTAAVAPFPAETNRYNIKGQLTNQVDADGNSTIFAYNKKGERAYSIVDSNRNFFIEFLNGTDRITYVTNDVLTSPSHGVLVNRSRTYVWNTSAATSNLVSTVEMSVDGSNTWRTVWNGSVGVTSQTTVSNDTANGWRVITNFAPDRSFSVVVMRYGTNVSTTQFDSATPPNQLSRTAYAYDPHGRLDRVTDARTGTTTYTFDDMDRILTVTTPDPDGAGPGMPQTTTRYYDNMGRVWKTTLPDNTDVRNEYFLTGELKKTHGARNYPVEYTYDAHGRMTTMTTWKEFNQDTGVGISGAATTTWFYNQYRGWLDKKVYQGETDTTDDYEYTAAGRLWKRHWERGVDTTYTYNWAGDLGGVDYSDSTPDASYDYDRLGRRVTLKNGGSLACTYGYNDANELITETFGIGSQLDGLAVTNGYDPLLRRTNVTVLSSSSQILTRTAFGYDKASRLSAVTNGTRTAFYGYLANSPLVETVTAKENDTLNLTSTKSYDNLNRLRGISSAPSGAGVAPVSFNYAYNSANQRTAVTREDSSKWQFGYDTLGQVTSGKKYWSDATPVSGQQFEYVFDDIGNRKNIKRGGNSDGTGLRTLNYTANGLNQYTAWDVDELKDITGTADPAATVTVNADGSLTTPPTTYRRGSYFHVAAPGEDTPPTTAHAHSYNLAAVRNQNNAPDVVTTQVGREFIPAKSFVPIYDTDGNLTYDGQWNYTWDAEKRLIQMSGQTVLPGQTEIQYQTIRFEYDARGRRIGKKVWNSADSSGAPDLEQRFIYDGWNLLAVLNSSSTVVQSFMWGLDLSGTMQGAGGVGGLLAVIDTANGAHFVGYDGNGNVAALVRAGDGTVSANYEFGPFGEMIRATGLMAKANPVRFSSKYQDDESDLLYYGYRFFNPSSGRWLSRDILEEAGGVNTYAFFENDLNDNVDAVGLQGFINHPPPTDFRNTYPNPNYPAFSSTQGRPIQNVLPYAADLSIKDKWVRKVRETDDTNWFLSNSDARAATLRAARHFRLAINQRLCGKKSEVSSFLVAPIGQGGAYDYAFEQSAMMSSFVIGWWEYRFMDLVGVKNGDRIEWTAQIAIIDKMGWEDEKYGVIFSDFLDYLLPRNWAYKIGPNLNSVPKFIFGASNREFRRGRLNLKGTTDCCNLEFVGHEESYFPLGGL